MFVINEANKNRQMNRKNFAHHFEAQAVSSLKSVCRRPEEIAGQHLKGNTEDTLSRRDTHHYFIEAKPRELSYSKANT